MKPLNHWLFDKAVRKLTKHTMYDSVQRAKNDICSLCRKSHWKNDTIDLREAIECIDRHFEVKK